MTMTVDQINAMPAPLLRRALRELKVEPESIGGGSSEAMKAKLIELLHPVPAAKKAPGKKAKPAPEPEPVAEEEIEEEEEDPAPKSKAPKVKGSVPSVAVVDGDRLGQIEVQMKDLIMRVATLELANGVAAGMRDAPPAPQDAYASLSKYLQDGDDGEQTLAIEMADLDELNETQLHALAQVLSIPVQGAMSVRALRALLRAPLQALLGDAEEVTSPPPAAKPGRKPAGEPALELKDGSIVVAQIDGQVEDPIRLVFMRGKKWVAVHANGDVEEALSASAIRGLSKKKWPEPADELLFEADFADFDWS